MGTAQILSPRAVRGNFWKRLEERTEESWARDLALPTESDQNEEEYALLHQIPTLREWLGARQAKQLKGSTIKIPNKKYETTLVVPVDDMVLDKSPQVMARVGDLSARVAQFPQKRVTEELEANPTAYDGVTLFGNHTKFSKVNNALTDSSVTDPTKPTSDEVKSGLLTCAQTILGVLDNEDEPMNPFAREFMVMVPTAYYSATVAALRDEFTSAGVSNTLRGVQADGMRFRVVVNPRLTAPSSTGVFYVFRTDADVKPFIWQDRIVEGGRMGTVFDELTEGSDFKFDNDAYKFGVKRVGGVGPAMFEMACRMTFS